MVKHLLRWVLLTLLGRPSVRIRTDRITVFFANHSSNMDNAVIWTALEDATRARTRFVAGEDYWGHGFVRTRIAKAFNALLINRREVTRENNPLEKMLDCLKNGDNLVLYPEGTRSTTDEIGDFRAGIYHLAKKTSDVDFVPIKIVNASRMMPKGSFVPLPIICRVSVGEPIQFTNQSKADFLMELKKSLEAM